MTHPLDRALTLIVVGLVLLLVGGPMLWLGLLTCATGFGLALR